MIDLTELEWRSSLAGSSQGMLNKTDVFENQVHYYYKTSRICGREIVGFESVFEHIASRLFDVLEIPHVSYDLIPAKIVLSGDVYETYICRSRDYKSDLSEVIPIQEYCPDSLLAEQQIIHDFGKQVLFQVYLADFLIDNMDRHGRNLEIEALVDSLRIAPLFDHGCSLFSWATADSNIDNYDVMKHRRSGNYVGDPDLFINLSRIDEPVIVKALTQRARRYIFANVTQEALPQQIATKTWELIWRRYNYAKDNNFLIERQSASTQTSRFFSSD